MRGGIVPPLTQLEAQIKYAAVTGIPVSTTHLDNMYYNAQICIFSQVKFHNLLACVPYYKLIKNLFVLPFLKTLTLI